MASGRRRDVGWKGKEGHLGDARARLRMTCCGSRLSKMSQSPPQKGKFPFPFLSFSLPLTCYTTLIISRKVEKGPFWSLCWMCGQDEPRQQSAWLRRSPLPMQEHVSLTCQHSSPTLTCLASLRLKVQTLGDGRGELHSIRDDPPRAISAPPRRAARVRGAMKIPSPKVIQ